MTMVKRLILLLCGVYCWASTAPTTLTDEAEDVVSVPDVLLRISQFAVELRGIAQATDVQVEVDPRTSVSPALIASYCDHIRSLELSFRSLLTRWDTYQLAQQYEIAASDTLLLAMADLDQLRQAVADSIAKRKEVCQALKDFHDGEQYIQNQDTLYKKLYKQAFSLSLVPKSAPLLAKLKAREALAFADLQLHYDKVKAAVALVPALAPRLHAVDDHFIELKAVSAKIQQMSYKPLMVRIKDYLIGFAAVAILLLFFNLIVQKYRASKKAREAMKQYQGMLNDSRMNNEYPTI